MKETYLTHKERQKEDHYELTCEQWRKKFLEMDHSELCGRFHLKSDADALYIVYYDQEYRLDRRNGMITLADDSEQKLPFNTIITIYNLFYYAKPEARIGGEFVPFRQVKRAAPFDPAFQRTVLRPLAATFDGHCDLLKKACEALKGTPISQSDAGYVIHAFDCIPLTITFWDGDEEFPAQANILFDADMTDFLHEETVVCVASDLVRRLTEEAGLLQDKMLMGGSL